MGYDQKNTFILIYKDYSPEQIQGVQKISQDI